MKLESQARKMLEKIGVNKGQTILDFGCGYGTYTIPAAKIAGEQGKVYALDKDRQVLDELMQKATSAGLKNIRRMQTSGELEIDLVDESVDKVLLFDVFHSYYFLQIADREKLLAEIYRIMKPSASLSVWPKHMESEAGEEIKDADFHLVEEFSGMLVHENNDIEKGKVLNFEKE
ncbi:MAG: class I SAM-dependent methyltransferase [Dehalococcoidia bacterium]|nr:class I SAM-dependent methyltransferase [Dehalococcoidia bacterium]